MHNSRHRLQDERSVQSELITPSEAAGMLGVTVEAVHYNIKRGKLAPVTKLPGARGAYLLSAPDVFCIAEAGVIGR